MKQQQQQQHNNSTTTATTTQQQQQYNSNNKQTNKQAYHLSTLASIAQQRGLQRGRVQLLHIEIDN